jgi:ankyrin repeat protein
LEKQCRAVGRTPYGVPVDLRNSVGLTPLVYAAAEGYVELVKVLLASGANANHLSSPLKFGIIKKRVDVVDILLEKGADPNEREDEFHTLLTMAGSNTVEYYSKYPDLGYTKPWMRNPLTMAIEVKNTDLMEVLVRHGADLNYVTVRGNTPLHIAAYKDSEELCLKLLKLGANKELKNRKGLTPYEVAYARNKDTLGNTIVDF